MQFPNTNGKNNNYNNNISKKKWKNKLLYNKLFPFFFGKYHDCNFLKKYIIIRIEINEIENVNLAE